MVQKEKQIIMELNKLQVKFILLQNHQVLTGQYLKQHVNSTSLPKGKREEFKSNQELYFYFCTVSQNLTARINLQEKATESEYQCVNKKKKNNDYWHKVEFLSLSNLHITSIKQIDFKF